jgi:hypothetical protein
MRTAAQRKEKRAERVEKMDEIRSFWSVMHSKGGVDVQKISFTAMRRWAREAMGHFRGAK